MPSLVVTELATTPRLIGAGANRAIVREKEDQGLTLQATALHRIENLSIIFDPLATLVPTEEALYRIRIRGQRAGDHRIQVQLTSDEHTTPITKEEVTRVYADR